ncbi:RNA polymerase sigma factor [Membranihabitans marinus]|uniref:RNA polymerase sigma factor n=1 Tax=Membranihabitans marinus TaxID=1227546 RepID=UPI001F031DEC|nr:sigma-70 family RNA polymerase sigma factor [Membranihabitans marinus]
MADWELRKSLPDLDETFETIYQENIDRVYHYIESIVHNPAAAEDLTAEVFLTLWKKRESLLKYENIVGLLYKISKDTAITYLKTLSKNSVKREKFFQFYFREEMESDEVLLREIQLSALEQAIEQLPEKCQKVVKMKFIMDKSLKEIAAELHISVNTVQNHLTKGKFLIKELMTTNDAFLVLVICNSLSQL